MRGLVAGTGGRKAQMAGATTRRSRGRGMKGGARIGSRCRACWGEEVGQWIGRTCIVPLVHPSFVLEYILHGRSSRVFVSPLVADEMSGPRPRPSIELSQGHLKQFPRSTTKSPDFEKGEAKRQGGLSIATDAAMNRFPRVDDQKSIAISRLTIK